VPHATGAGLSRTEMNVLQTMTTVIVVFVLFWSVTVTASFLGLIGVSSQYHINGDANNSGVTKRGRGAVAPGRYISNHFTQNLQFPPS